VGAALLTDVDVVLAGGRVVALGRNAAPADADVIDVPGGVIAPGFVDLHVHAVAGHGVIRTDALDPVGMARALAARGVTSFLATTVAAPEPDLLAAVRAVNAVPEDGGARCLGVHLEGPWLSPERPGAQPSEHLTSPDAALLDRLRAGGPIAMVTLAPELPGAVETIRAATRAGVIVAVGHSSATFEQALAAVGAGARHVTHAFNAMHGLHHREPGLIGAALDLPELSVEVIADGVHVHPAVVRLLWRACGPRRLCLVSDAVELDAAGSGAAVRRPDGVLAGSRIGLDAAVRHVVDWGIPLSDALTMAATTPARVLGRADLGELRVGAAADAVILDEQLDVAATVVGGRVTYRAAQ
jgi:N-acetylglucosamine-6-phosphate deacetylase